MSESNKIWVSVGYAFLFLLLFSPTNHFHLFKPTLLPFTPIDRNVPFMPYSMWIYISDYVFFFVAFFVAKDILTLNKYLYALFFLLIATVIVFILFPTTYPRDLYPLPGDLDPLTFYSFNMLRILDSPASCLPSHHVSSCFLTSFIYLHDQKEKFPLFFGWATLIAISTLTTKQHYFVDVVGGFGMASISYWVFFKWANYKGAQANL